MSISLKKNILKKKTSDISVLKNRFIDLLKSFYYGNISAISSVDTAGMCAYLSFQNVGTAVVKSINGKELVFPERNFFMNRHTVLTSRIIRLFNSLSKILFKRLFPTMGSLVIIGSISFIFSITPTLKYLFSRGKEDLFYFKILVSIEQKIETCFGGVFSKQPNSFLKESPSDLKNRPFSPKGTLLIPIALIAGLLAFKYINEGRPDNTPYTLIAIFIYFYFFRTDRFSLLEFIDLKGENPHGFLMNIPPGKEQEKEVSYFKNLLPAIQQVHSGDQNCILLKVPIKRFEKISGLKAISHFFSSSISSAFRLIFNLIKKGLVGNRKSWGSIIAAETDFFSIIIAVIKIHLITYLFCRKIFEMVLKDKKRGFFLLLAFEYARLFDFNILINRENYVDTFPLFEDKLSILACTLIFIIIFTILERKPEKGLENKWPFFSSGILEDLILITFNYQVIKDSVKGLTDKGLWNYIWYQKEIYRILFHYLFPPYSYFFIPNYFDHSIKGLFHQKIVNVLPISSIFTDPIFFIASFFTKVSEKQNRCYDPSLFRKIDLIGILLYIALRHSRGKNHIRGVIDNFKDYTSFLSVYRK